MMHGIDISGHQAANTPALVPNDFAIIKATGGSGFVNPKAAQQRQAAPGRSALYHFAGDGYPWTTPEVEAGHFLAHWRALARPGDVPILDWEQQGHTHETGWAERWIRIVTAATGKTPLLYCNLSVARSYDWSRVQGLGVKLWLAMYGDDARVDGYRNITDPELTVDNGWGPVAIWQYTQHGHLPGYADELDLNVAYMDVWAPAEPKEENLIDGIRLRKAD